MNREAATVRSRNERCRSATVFQELARMAAVKSRSRASLNFSNVTFFFTLLGCLPLLLSPHGGDFGRFFLWSPLGGGRFQMELITLRPWTRIHPFRRSSDAALMLNKRARLHETEFTYDAFKFCTDKLQPLNFNAI